LDGDGDASSEVEDFFFVAEVELVPPFDFFVVEVEDFLVVAAVPECVVVVAVSCLWAQEVTKAVAARTVMKPRTNFFIVKGIWIRNVETVQFAAGPQAIKYSSKVESKLRPTRPDKKLAVASVAKQQKAEKAPSFRLSVVLSRPETLRSRAAPGCAPSRTR
jgi:hypothetical protein